MPLFFFHLRSPAGVERDDVGLEYANLELAYLEAVRAIPSLAADLLRDGQNPMAYAFDIVDADDTPLLEVPFNETARNTRKLRRPSPQAARQLMLVDDVHDLVAAVQRNVDLLQKQMRESRELMAVARRTNQGEVGR